MRKKLELNLALQGGGAHGAFTWGVLDRLLEDEGLEFGWISATSAGAVNAVAMASGLATGSRQSARENLFKVWQAVHKAGVPDLMRFNPLLYGLSRTNSLAQVATLWSPYEFNPLGFDPLRRILADHVDFDALRAKSGCELLIAATHVPTGRARLFRRAELTIEAVLASACLPTVHHAVEIEGAAYWDGGFSANPDLVTVAVESPVADTLLVTLSPLVIDEHPMSVRDISNHATRLTFNAPLLRDVEIINAVRETVGAILLKGHLAPIARHRFHLIDASPVTANMSPETTIKPEWGTITFLHGAGRSAADVWLAENRAAIGKFESVDLPRHFFGRSSPTATPVPVPSRRIAEHEGRARVPLKRSS
ncbi:MAG TPA: patatin-like phospholipase family protein [Hyphomicrobium sp.]|nr:patatin-like phospholipase family protein [Hyphomicrobium sp.]